MPVPQIDWFALAPEIALTATALLVMLTELFLDGARKRFVNPLGIIGVLVSLGFVIALALDGANRSAFGNMFVVDEFALLFKAFFLAVAGMVLLLSYRYIGEIATYQGEYYFLMLSSFLGMLLMASARDLVMLFVALELVSVPGFVMAGLRKFDLRSNEGALKFFLMGVLSVAVLLFGLSIVYGFTGTTDLAGVAAGLEQAPREPLLLASLLFVITGFGFKVSAVPFHFWAPDTYEGAPVPVTAFLSVASKAAGFVGLAQICFVAFAPLADVWAPVLGIIAVITMTFGNLVALQQRNMVRLFAYSSIAHAGYMLVPFGVARADGGGNVNQEAMAGLLVYLMAYAVMNIGAFAVITAMARRHPGRAVGDYAGLGARSPGLAVALTMFVLSLGGIPPLVGLWAKLFIFFAAANAGTAFGYFLAGAVVVNSVIAMFYYLSIARTIWMDAPAHEGSVRPGRALGFAVAVLAALSLVGGIIPGPFREAAERSTLVSTVP